MEGVEVGRRDEDYVEQGMSDATERWKAKERAGKKQGKRGMGRGVWGAGQVGETIPHCADQPWRGIP